MSMSAPTVRLDFAIVGAQKCGTSALAAYLGQHSRLFLPPTKETHFFRREERAGKPVDCGGWHLDKYYLDRAAGQLLGDATPVYVYWPHALELIKQHNPEIRLIVCIRHPALRAFSSWAMEVARGRETLSFSEAIRAGRQRVSSAPGGVHKIFSYVERGFFSAQFDRLLSLFPREQIFVLRSDQISAQSPEMPTLLDFLGVERKPFIPITRRVGPEGFDPPGSALDDLLFLHELYLDDLSRLVQVHRLPVEDWLSDDVVRSAVGKPATWLGLPEPHKG